MNNTQDRRIRLVYSDLLRLCRPFLKQKDALLLRKAYEMMLEHHRPEYEKTLSDHLYHAIEVARIVIRELNLGIPSVICALLHNVVDGKKVTAAHIREQFGEEIATIVDGYVRLSSLRTEKISVHSENFRKLYLSLIRDIRVMLVKLAHRLQDMRYFDHLEGIKQDIFLEEVQHIYIPIAHRLGLYHIKAELEELWMTRSQPEVYETIRRKMKETGDKQQTYINDFIDPLQTALKNHGLDAEIKGRPKSIYSIWRKMKKQNVEYEEVYDVFAIRIILPTEGKNEKGDCWRAYSIVTDIYPPNPGRLRDWISTPKASGYESLHTTVLGSNKKWVEVQIRSQRMDEVAEKGLAAHWRYKESMPGKDQEEWMNRIREVLENPGIQSEEKSRLAGINLYTDRIFVFTPEGDLKKLPSGSTVLDFAYEIHSTLGDMCSGARVNGRIVPIRHLLRNGDKVEIMTSKNQKPKLDWLGFVVTPKATAKIKRALKEEKMKEAEAGKDILRRKLRNRKIPFSDNIVDKLIRKHRLKSSVDLYYLIATEKIDLADIKKVAANDMPETQADAGKEKEGKETRTIADKGDIIMLQNMEADNLNYELAKCCNPIQGDEVFGFIAVGKGITIHRKDCPNAALLQSKYKYRIIDVDWTAIDTGVTTIRVEGKDETGILNNIVSVISAHFAVNIVSVKVNTRKPGRFEGNFKIRVKDVKHLNLLIEKIRKVKGVQMARRHDRFSPNK